MEKRAIDVWLDEQNAALEDRRTRGGVGANHTQLEEEWRLAADDPRHVARALNEQMLQEFAQEKQASEALRAQVAAQVDSATRERAHATAQALQDARRQVQEAQQALDAHSAEIPPANASAAWVTKFATRKATLQNELEVYQGMAQRAEQAHHDALGVFNSQAHQLAQQIVWKAQQEFDELQRKNKAAFTEALATWQRIGRESQESEKQAHAALQLLKNRLLGG